MSPLAGHTVIHPASAALHAPVVVSAMTATVRITRRTATFDDDDAGWDPDAGASAPAADDDVWTGPARLQAQASGVLNPEVAEQEVTTRDYLVQLPLAVPPLSAGDGGDAITVLLCPDDPQMVGRRLRVTDIPYGSVLWSRDVVATDDLTANGPRS